jgi:hypothetical protein
VFGHLTALSNIVPEKCGGVEKRLAHLSEAAASDVEEFVSVY